jgi:peptide/nickel transport system permease protein
MIPTLVLITAVVFAVVKIAPGNPFSFAQSTGEGAVRQMNPADYQALLVRYGLDRPWYVQYWKWLKSAATGSFGDSFSERRPVVDVMFSGAFSAFTEGLGPVKASSEFVRRLASSRFGATIFLNGLSLLLMLLVAIPAGFLAASKRGGWFDRISSFLLYGLYSLPNFWLAVLLIILFGVKLKLLPFLGMHSDGYRSLSAGAALVDALEHAVLPGLCLAAGGLAFMARFARGSLLEVLNQDYIRTAKAKGLGEGAILRRHAAPNALVPLLTLLGLLLPALISGSVIIEQIFAWPGLGQMTIQAITARDYPVIMAVAVMGAVAVLVSNLLTDVAYHLADPRVRLE